MEEIGCHFKFEKIMGNIYHDTNLLLSSGRNCLRYIIKERKITAIFLPYFLCESLYDVAISENVKVELYHIDDNYMPMDIDKSKLDDTTYVYFVNYYGLFRDNIQKIIDKYKYVIIDNTHDFFNTNNYRVDVIYNYRKYFGVPDGACIISNDLTANYNYTKGKSAYKVMEMLLRDETGQYLHYPSFLEADKHFRNENLHYMSNFTENYLRAINYEKVLKTRLENYNILSELLDKYNRLNLSKEQLTYMYPLFVLDGESLRNYLKANNIYSLRLWANINWNGANTDEIKKADNMVLLPIDQRYSANEMEYIVDVIDKFYLNNHTRDKVLILKNEKMTKILNN